LIWERNRGNSEERGRRGRGFAGRKAREEETALGARVGREGMWAGREREEGWRHDVDMQYIRYLDARCGGLCNL